MVLAEYDEKKHINNEKRISWEEGRLEGRLEGVIMLVQKKGFSLQEALSTLDVSMEEWNKYNS